METKAKKRLLNGLMIMMLIVLAAAGVLAAGKIQGWFGGSKETVVISGAIKGVADMERKGIGYMVDTDTAFQKGDTVAARDGAQAELLIQETGSMTLNGNTEILISECSTKEIALELKQGEFFADAAAYEGTLQVTVGEVKADLTGCVFSIDRQEEKSNISVYAGNAKVYLADDTEETVKAGNILTIENDSISKNTQI